MGSIARITDDAARSDMGPLTLDGVAFRHLSRIQKLSISTVDTRGRRKKLAFGGPADTVSQLRLPKRLR